MFPKRRKKKKKGALAPNLPRTHKKQHRFHCSVRSGRHGAIPRKWQIKNQTNRIKI